MQGLVGPKGSVRTNIDVCLKRMPRKGSELIFLHLYIDGYNEMLRGGNANSELKTF